jgi:tetratricopeptide (TPR) repeat protein
LKQQRIKNSEVDKAELYFHLAWNYEQQGSSNTEQTIDYYKQCIKKTESSALAGNANFRIAWVLMHNNDYQNAQIYFHNAIHCLEKEQNHIYYDAIYWYAFCLERHGGYLEALKYYQCLDNHSELMFESFYRQIICRNHVGDFEAALKICETFLSKNTAEIVDKNRYTELEKMLQTEKDSLVNLFKKI